MVVVVMISVKQAYHQLRVKDKRFEESRITTVENEKGS